VNEVTRIFYSHYSKHF